MADLEKLKAELKAEHDKLTKAFESAQKEAEAKRAVEAAAAEALTTFRAKNGKVLKAMDDVKVEG